MSDSPRSVERNLVRIYNLQLGRRLKREWFADNVDTRYRVMLDLIRPHTDPVTLLDFGCGLSPLYDYIVSNGITGIEYSGLDLSQPVLQKVRLKNPQVPYYRADILDPHLADLPVFDYIVAKQVFTYRAAHSYEDTLDYLEATVARLFEHTRIGLAFNVMSKQVDWELPDVLHLPVDTLLRFLSTKVSRHVVIRHDYGLYEYTAYVYREPSDQQQAGARRLIEPTP